MVEQPEYQLITLVNQLITVDQSTIRMSSRKHTPNRPDCTPDAKLSQATLDLLIHRKQGSRARKYSLGANIALVGNQDISHWDMPKREQRSEMREVYDFGNVSSNCINISTGSQQGQCSAKDAQKNNPNSHSRAHKANQSNRFSNSVALDENLTAKLVISKKLEKLETTAIRQYYEHNVEECWLQLNRCMQIIDSQQRPGWYFEHALYVLYLQASFHCKLHNYAQSRQALVEAMQLLPKLNSEQVLKTKHYVTSLQAIHCRLLYQQNKHTQAIAKIDDLLAAQSQNKSMHCKPDPCNSNSNSNSNTTLLPEKTIRSLQLIRIEASSQLTNHNNTMDLCACFIQKWGTAALTCKQICRIYCILAQCHNNNNNNNNNNSTSGSTEQAYNLLESAIEILTKRTQQTRSVSQIRGQNVYSSSDTIAHDDRVGDRTQSSISEVYSCIDKVYGCYFGLLESEPNLIACLKVCKNYRAQFPDSVNPACVSLLLRALHGMGDYEQCLQVYSSSAQQSHTANCNPQDMIIIADIHYSYNDTQASQSMLTKAWDLLQHQSKKKNIDCEQIKLHIEVRLLRFVENSVSGTGTGTGKLSQRKERMRALERKIKENKSRPWIHGIVKLYSEYLASIEQESRLNKLLVSWGLVNSNSNKYKPDKQKDELVQPDRPELMHTAKFGNLKQTY